MMMIFMSIFYSIVYYFSVNHHSSCTWPGVIRRTISL